MLKALCFLNLLICAISISSVYSANTKVRKGNSRYTMKYNYPALINSKRRKNETNDSLHEEKENKEDTVNKVLSKLEQLCSWMGVLIYMHSVKLTNSSAVVFLIAPSFAISNAEVVIGIHDEYLSTNFTSVIFPSGVNLTMERRVPLKNCYPHPEYPFKTKNSVGVIELLYDVVPEFDKLHPPLRWPRETNYNNTDIYLVEFVRGDDGLIQQKISTTYVVHANYCKESYVRAEMDISYIWPTHYICLKQNSDEACTYYEGMAAFSYIAGGFTLLAISTNGPGCAFPSRFIEFFPYTTWIENIIPKSKPKSGRRAATLIDISKIELKWTLRILHNLTTNQLDLQIHNNSMRIVPDNKTCKDLGEMSYVYTEAGYVDNHSGLSGVGIYSISMHDRTYEIKCITVLLIAPWMSKDIAYITQEGYSEVDIEFVVNRLIPMDLHDTKHDKKLYLKDHYLQFRHDTVTTIIFQFAFHEKMEVVTQFYGTTFKGSKVQTFNKTDVTTKKPPKVKTDIGRTRTHATYRWFIYGGGR